MQRDCKRHPIKPHDKSHLLNNTVCEPGGYLESQGYSVEPARAIIPKIQSLLEAFRSFGFTVYHTREGHRPDLSTLSSREQQRSKKFSAVGGIGDKGPLGRLLVRGEPGHDIIPELYPLPNEPIIDKPGKSAFQYTDLRLLLDVKGVKNLVICGVTTDVCVSTTMRDANDMGFDCLLVSDACAAGLQELHEAAVKMVVQEGGIFGAVTTTDAILEKIGF
ncbi:isochorismatase family protein [Coniochaeta ligniaria NRRL 30616]|uniref:Isochorismatase family protein n=1 Tax=Coniochaeta ligniaria NRRL 30616 TaxID=1408157 RepID=A0A1J7JT09_9PEZI|nr:isochorismatase family protein [Coniochaeta ligniaria NRRL 30616]